MNAYNFKDNTIQNVILKQLYFNMQYDFYGNKYYIMCSYKNDWKKSNIYYRTIEKFLSQYLQN